MVDFHSLIPRRFHFSVCVLFLGFALSLLTSPASAQSMGTVFNCGQNLFCVYFPVDTSTCSAPPAPDGWFFRRYLNDGSTCGVLAEFARSACPDGQEIDESTYQCKTSPPSDCGPHGTRNPNGSCSCDDGYYRANDGGFEMCGPCPIPGYLLGEAPTFFSGEGDVPDGLCLEPINNVGGSGCWRETQSSTRQGSYFSATAMRWSGQSCVVEPESVTTIRESEASPDNPNTPDDCLSAGMGFVQVGDNLQCVQNGTDSAPVTNTTKSTTTNSDGSKSVTTTTSTSTTNNTHTSSTTTTYNNGNTQGAGDKNETSETTTGNGTGSSGDSNCGAPGQPACRVTITGGTGDGESVSGQLADVAETFNGEAEKGLLGSPMDGFLSTARNLLEEAVFLPELESGSCSPFVMWDGVSIDFCAEAEIGREILSWIFYVGACFFGWMQLQRAIDGGSA
jgi:hypothetical protein